jgi:hypothetical protein
MFQRNVLSPSSGSKNKSCKQPAWSKQTEMLTENLVRIQTCKGATRERVGARRRVTSVGPKRGCICKSGEMGEGWKRVTQVTRSSQQKVILHCAACSPRYCQGPPILPVGHLCCFSRAFSHLHLSNTALFWASTRYLSPVGSFCSLQAYIWTKFSLHRMLC